MAPSSVLAMLCSGSQRGNDKGSSRRKLCSTSAEAVPSRGSTVPAKRNCLINNDNDNDNNNNIMHNCSYVYSARCQCDIIRPRPSCKILLNMVYSPADIFCPFPLNPPIDRRKVTRIQSKACRDRFVAYGLTFILKMPRAVPVLTHLPTT